MQANRCPTAAAHWLGLLAALLLTACAGGRGPAGAPAAPVTDTGQSQTADTLRGARLALAEQRPYDVLKLLPDVPEDASPAHQAEISTLRAQAYGMAGNALENARERCRLDMLLTDPEARRTNHRAIWAALAVLSPSALEQLRTAPPPDVLSGWMELAAIARATTADKSALAARIDTWQRRYRNHPAGTHIVPALLGRPESPMTAPAAGNSYPPRVAVLLPLSGQYAQEALALRNGLLAAYYRQRWGGTPPQLRFYDTGAAGNGLRRFYDQAVSEGAGLVLGPLTRAAVTDLARGGPLTVPVLALNQIDSAAPDRLYQFAIAPEDEARQAAERASLDGHTHALAIVPVGDWGARLLNAFTQRFQELGGGVTAVQRYGVNSDFAVLVQKLLARDPDAAAPPVADMLFMVAFPEQARRITGQLHAEQGGALPVYATSHIYSGHTEANDAASLDGVIFCDMPWLLSPDSLSSSEYTRSARLWPDSLQTHPRLYALGIDAYNLIPYLGRLGTSATTGYPGETGRLYLDAARRLHRQLMWARYSGGSAVPLDNTPLTWTPTTR